MTHTNGMPTHEELTTLPREVVTAKIDQAIGTTVNEWRLLYVLLLREELARRDQADSTLKMLDFTSQVRTMTAIILGATVINVAAAVAMLFKP